MGPPEAADPEGRQPIVPPAVDPPEVADDGDAGVRFLRQLLRSRVMIHTKLSRKMTVKADVSDTIQGILPCTSPSLNPLPEPIKFRINPNAFKVNYVKLEDLSFRFK